MHVLARLLLSAALLVVAQAQANAYGSWPEEPPAKFDFVSGARVELVTVPKNRMQDICLPPKERGVGARVSGCTKLRKQACVVYLLPNDGTKRWRDMYLGELARCNGLRR